MTEFQAIPVKNYARGTRRQFSIGLASLALCLAGQLGCFDADALIEARRLEAIRARLEEIDLGTYRISLTSPESVNDSVEVNFHVFGLVANRDLETVSEYLDSKKPEIRDKMLIVTRSLSDADLEDPKLSLFRDQIASIVNDTLEDEPVQSIGFYHFRYSVF